MLILSLSLFAQGQNITLANLKKIAYSERISVITSFVKQFGYKLSKTETDEEIQEVRWELSSNSDYEIIFERNSETKKTRVSWYTPSAAIFERLKKDILSAGYTHKMDMYDNGIASFYVKKGSGIMIKLREEPLDIEDGTIQYFRIELITNVEDRED